MQITVFLAQCVDTLHKEDASAIRIMKEVSGIHDAFETFFRYQDDVYCLAGMSNTKEEEHEEIIRKILENKNIKAVKKIPIEESPF